VSIGTYSAIAALANGRQPAPLKETMDVDVAVAARFVLK